MEALVKQALQLDQAKEFEASAPIWEKLIQKDICYLEQRLSNLIALQTKYCENPLTQCRLSMTYHYIATNVLENYGSLLGDKKYYYRAMTYQRTALYLAHMSLYECAVDCYFRALIFQGNFKAWDGGKEKLLTIMGIMQCYYELDDEKMLIQMAKEFDTMMMEADDFYQGAWLLLKAMMKLGDESTLNKGKALIPSQSLADLLSLFAYFGYQDKIEQLDVNYG